MLYIDKTQTTATLLIPTNGNELPGTSETPSLVVKSTSDLLSVDLTGEWSYPSEKFARLDLTVPESLTLGEWEYTYAATGVQGTRVLSTGILRVVQSEDEVTEYGTTTNYKQYGE